MSKLDSVAENEEANIRALVAQWSAAIEAKDADAAVANYAPDTVLYDAIPPFRTTGAEAIRAIWQQCFPHFPERFKSEHRDLQVTVDGDLAIAHGLHRFVPEPADHPCGATWVRMTVSFRRAGGRWRVFHEHVSVPFDPASSKAHFTKNI